MTSQQFNEMNSAPANSFDAGHCPLCGQPNDCRLCTGDACKGPCWCVKVNLPEELIAQVSSGLQKQACPCRACVMKFHRARANGSPPPKISTGDFYFDRGLMVLTATFHLRRGYCCDHGCRHCPYQARPAITP